MTVKIDIKRTGFPVKIGSIELWFDSSVENLRNFLNAEEIAQEKLKEAQEKTQHIHFPKDEEDIKGIDVRSVDAAIDLQSEFIAAQYDIVFGDGTFKNIYKQYPDIIALESALDPLFIAIAKKIDEQEKERSEEVESKKKEYLQKKQAKRN